MGDFSVAVELLLFGYGRMEAASAERGACRARDRSPALCAQRPDAEIGGTVFYLELSTVSDWKAADARAVRPSPAAGISGTGCDGIGAEYLAPTR